MSMMTLIRSSRTEVFCKRVVLRNFAKFTAKHLCQSLFFNKVAGTPFIIEHLWWLLVPNADFFKWLCFQYNVKWNVKTVHTSCPKISAVHETFLCFNASDKKKKRKLGCMVWAVKVRGSAPLLACDSPSSFNSVYLETILKLLDPQWQQYRTFKDSCRNTIKTE